MAEGSKDAWDKLAIVLAPLGGLLTAAAVAVVGVMGSRLIEHRQSLDTNARLYSELMSRREEAESNLRKDMLQSIMQSFLNPQSDDLASRVLSLELLAYNFHESLNLKPLFREIERRIQSVGEPDRRTFRERLNRVAREITAKQLFALEGHGPSFGRLADLEELAARGRAGVPLDPETIDADGGRLEVGLRVLGADVDLQRLRVRLEIKDRAGRPDWTDTSATFEVGWYDFPMIDNTRLANGWRCAVTLGAFSPVTADLKTVCFPGEYASLKDRPYYDEVIQKLQGSAARAGEAGHAAR